MTAKDFRFVPAKGAWGRAGWTMVRLASADGEAMTLAWQATVKPATPTGKRRS